MIKLLGPALAKELQDFCDMLNAQKSLTQQHITELQQHGSSEDREQISEEQGFVTVLEHYQLRLNNYIMHTIENAGNPSANTLFAQPKTAGDLLQNTLALTQNHMQTKALTPQLMTQVRGNLDCTKTKIIFENGMKEALGFLQDHIDHVKNPTPVLAVNAPGL
jgi:hypothetical protein